MFAVSFARRRIFEAGLAEAVEIRVNGSVQRLAPGTSVESLLRSLDLPQTMQGRVRAQLEILFLVRLGGEDLLFLEGDDAHAQVCELGGRPADRWSSRPARRVPALDPQPDPLRACGVVHSPGPGDGGGDEQAPAVLGVVVRTGQADREGPVRMEVLHLEAERLCIELERDLYRRPCVDDGVGDQLAGGEHGLVGDVLGLPLGQRFAHEQSRLGDGLPLRRERALGLHGYGEYLLATFS